MKYKIIIIFYIQKIKKLYLFSFRVSILYLLLNIIILQSDRSWIILFLQFNIKDTKVIKHKISKSLKFPKHLLYFKPF